MLWTCGSARLVIDTTHGMSVLHRSSCDINSMTFVVSEQIESRPPGTLPLALYVPNRNNQPCTLHLG
jgi:hypothetical protein